MTWLVDVDMYLATHVSWVDTYKGYFVSHKHLWLPTLTISRALDSLVLAADESL